MNIINRICAAILAVVLAVALIPSSSFATQREVIRIGGEDRVDTAIDIAEEYHSGETVRLGGSDRFETSALIARKGWKSTNNVVLANAYDFADALAGVPLAAALEAPVLLTAADRLSDTVRAQISSLGAENVYILGGNAAVNASVESELTASGYKVRRIAGQTRFETSVLAAGELASIKGAPTGIFAAFGFNYPDALAASPVAGAAGMPIIYLPGSGALDPATVDYLSSCGCADVTILGGIGAVSEAVSDGVKAVTGKKPERIAGEDRYSTALEICRAYGDVLTGSGVAFATGTAFPDALAGGAFAARKRLPVLLVDPSAKKNALEDTYSYIKSRGSGKYYVFGGEAAVSDAALRRYLTKTESTTAKTKQTTKVTESTSSTVSTAAYDGGYIGNVKSLVFHRADCSGLPAEKNRTKFSTRDEAISAGYRPCGNCNP